MSTGSFGRSGKGGSNGDDGGGGVGGAIGGMGLKSDGDGEGSGGTKTGSNEAGRMHTCPDEAGTGGIRWETVGGGERE
jgi:hypothetical protein